MVGDADTRDFGSAVRARVRVVGRPFGVESYVACASVPDGHRRLGKTVNEVSNSVITGARSYRATVSLLQVLATEPAKTIQPLYPSAIADDIQDAVSR